MASKQIYKYILALIVPIFVLSCKSTKWVQDGDYLLMENEVYVDGKKIKSAELQNILKQKPNKTLTPIFRPYLWLYNMGNPNKKKGLAHWFTKIGEAPVIADSTSTLTSMRQLGIYFFSKGYFNNSAEVSKRIDKKNNKIWIRYDIYKGKPYYFGGFKIQINSPNILELVETDTTSKPLIKKGDLYDSDILEKERERLVRLFRNNGFYGFQKELIRFEADTSGENYSVNLTMIISDQPIYFKDSTYYRPHVPYTISEIYIDPYARYSEEKIINDTLTASGYTFLDSEENRYHPDLMVDAIHFVPNDTYNQTIVEESYSHLVSLKVFRSSEIKFEPIPNKDDELKAVISLNPFPKRSVKMELEGTNTNSNYGISGKFSIINRNLFKNGEIFDFSITGGLEKQAIAGESNDAFNTTEFGAEIGLDIPKFLIPSKWQDKFPKRILPKTRISFGIGQQKRQEFERYYFNAKLGYFWTYSKKVNMNFQLIDFSYLDIEEIQDGYINSLEFSQGYKPVLISGMKYTYTFNNQYLNNNKRTHSFFTGSAETSGNILQLLNAGTTNNNVKEIWGVAYAQYFKVDLDYRHYTTINKDHQFAWRVFGGYTHTYGNTDGNPPFEKSYFAGGSNDIRGWQAYKLGPGAFPESKYDKLQYEDDQGEVVEGIYTATGPIKIMFNAEYRFTLLGALKSALFCDLGNIWLYNKEIGNKNFINIDDKESLKFKLDSFYKQLAISPGIGLRYDFGFFLIRLDAGYKLYNPGAEFFKDRLFPSPTFGRNEIYRNTVTLNFAIGYPF